MPILIRKISKAKWSKEDGEITQDVSADAITGCLRTTSNKLSMWEVADEVDLNEAVIAIVSSGDKVESMDFVSLNTEFFQEQNIGIVKTVGRTAVKDLVDTHYSLGELTYSSLGHVSRHIAQRIKDGKSKRYTKNQLLGLIKEAMAGGRIVADDLKDTLRIQIET